MIYRITNSEQWDHKPAAVMFIAQKRLSLFNFQDFKAELNWVFKNCWSITWIFFLNSGTLLEGWRLTSLNLFSPWLQHEHEPNPHIISFNCQPSVWSRQSCIRMTACCRKLQRGTKSLSAFNNGRQIKPF